MDLLIATFRIRLEPADGALLLPGERFNAFLSEKEGIADIIIQVSLSEFSIPESAVKVFDAPLTEEENGRVVVSGKPFWCVWRSSEATFVKIFPAGGAGEKVLVMNDYTGRWELFLNSSETIVDPMEYPLDGLILYFLTSAKGAIMIHASAVNSNGRGWLFSGRSGSGKTTIARLFDSKGVEVVHDDRIILVKRNGRWIIHSTPVYKNDVPRCVPLDHVWLIEHGKSNVSVPVQGAMAIAMVLANCIQQTWDGNTTEALLSAIEDFTILVPVSKLAFVPDTSICDYLILRKEEKMESVFAVTLSLLRDGDRVTVTAGGISMWPAIKPNDKVIIEPLNNKKPTVGEVVALIRVGGFVVHRVKKVLIREETILYRTQGDATRADNLLSEGYEIAGKVKEIIRDGVCLDVKRKVMPFWINGIIARITGYLNP
jgi:hypothetical protein